MVRSGGNFERQRPRDQFRYLIQRINELQQKLKPSDEETRSLLKQLKSEGCEIYGATEDRGIMVLWICVQSRFTLATLNKDPGDRAAGGGPLNILERLLTHLCRSSYWNYQGPSIERRGAVVIDNEQLTTDVGQSYSRRESYLYLSTLSDDGLHTYLCLTWTEFIKMSIMYCNLFDLIQLLSLFLQQYNNHSILLWMKHQLIHELLKYFLFESRTAYASSSSCDTIELYVEEFYLSPDL